MLHTFRAAGARAAAATLCGGGSGRSRLAANSRLAATTCGDITKLAIYVPLLFGGGMHTIPDANYFRTYVPSGGGGGHSRLAATTCRGGGGQLANFFVLRKVCSKSLMLLLFFCGGGGHLPIFFFFLLCKVLS